LPEHEIVNGITNIIFQGKKYALRVFGKHNLANIEGARLLCNRVAVSDEDFYTAIQSFEGAGKRLESLGKTDALSIYKDFAHSPSKLKATAQSVKEQFPNKKVCAIMELHTFSSLNKEFLSQYKGAFGDVDTPVVFFDPKTVSSKGLSSISIEEVREAFEEDALEVFTDSDALKNFIISKDLNNHVLLMMSSGNWGSIDLNELSTELLNKY
jgi:UDP-N-acetylmuramate: L-alanyl-gamma-D-glutamyl-meso-diaminopimelate ligase